MVEQELLDLYNKLKKKLAELYDEVTFANFYRLLQSGKRSVGLKNVQTKKAVEPEWIEAIDKCIPHLDAIVNNPRSYMKQEADVVPIEKARRINSDSVKHLASHTNLISSVKDDVVRPNQILAPYNEQSLELYENRFIMTLIIRVSQFVDRRYFLLGTGGSEFSSSVEVEGEFDNDGEITNYKNQIIVNQGADYFSSGIQRKVYEDLFRVRKYINIFKYSPFMKEMSKYAAVRPPILKTNLLTKQPDYKACVELWNFIESYHDAGYTIEVTEFAPEFDMQLVDDFDAIALLEYIAVKNKMAIYDKRRRAVAKTTKKIVKPTIDERESDLKEELEKSGGGLQGINGGDAGEGDAEGAIRNALVRALRKDAARRALEEQREKAERERMEQMLADAIKRQREEERRYKAAEEAVVKDAVRGALKRERIREREGLREELKYERKVGQKLERYLNDYQKAAQKQQEHERMLQQSDEELYSALISDMLNIEAHRKAIHVAPTVLQGREYMPVPVTEQKSALPASPLPDTYKKFIDENLPKITDDDWKEIERTIKRERQSRPAAGVELALRRALKKAAALEKREREREQERARALEKIPNAEETIEKQSDIIDTAPPQNSTVSGDSDSGNGGNGDGSGSSVAAPQDENKRLPVAAEDEHLSLWRRIVIAVRRWFRKS